MNNAPKRRSTGSLHFRRARSFLLVAALLMLIYACDVASHSSLTPVDNTASVTPQSTSEIVVPNPGGGLPLLANKPLPVLTTYKGCPPTGDGGDSALNIDKNRTDSTAWYPVTIANLLNLTWPKSIEQKYRSGWSAADKEAIARYEGTPVQIEGWIAGVKQEGPESPNCHSVNDVDNHLWIVDEKGKDRSQSIVAEITPRMRAMHPGWAFPRIQGVVDGQLEVRISGWLMLDQEHPDQVNKTRGTIWEIHPITAFDVQGRNGWVSLDTGLASDTITQGSEAAPTEDPSLPPAITDPYTTATLPTVTPEPSTGQTDGQITASGDIEIDDIFYDGTKGSAEPDEYVEIANNGTKPVDMDGWQLHDIYGNQQFTWHGYTIGAHSKIRVYTNEVHSNYGGFTFGSKSAIWANKGDAAELIDANGTVVSTFTYGIR